MKLLTKDSSKRANGNSQKDTEDISNVITDIDSVTTMNNCVNNAITDMTNHVVIFFFFFLENDVLLSLWIIKISIIPEKLVNFSDFEHYFLVIHMPPLNVGNRINWTCKSY